MNRWTDLKIRTISSIVLTAGFLALLFIHSYTFSTLLSIAGIILMIEWVRLTKMRSYKWAWFVAGFFYIGIAMLSMAMLYHLSGPYTVLGLVLVVAAIDIGGYFVGKWIGRHKIWPSVSPGKSWEGLLGSFLFCLGTLLGLSYLSENQSSLAILSIFSAIFTILAVSGDLFESYLKRKAGVKDSGTLIPGHGGLFDRLDGLLPCAAFMGIFLFCWTYIVFGKLLLLPQAA